MSFLHIPAKFLINVSISFHDMSILITVRVSKRIEYAVKATRILRASHEKIFDIMLEWDIDRIPKIGYNLKSNEYFLIKFGQYMAKSHIKKAMHFSFSNINRIFIFGIFFTGFRFFGTPCIKFLLIYIPGYIQYTFTSLKRKLYNGINDMCRS